MFLYLIQKNPPTITIVPLNLEGSSKSSYLEGFDDQNYHWLSFHWSAVQSSVCQHFGHCVCVCVASCALLQTTQYYYYCPLSHPSCSVVLSLLVTVINHITPIVQWKCRLSAFLPPPCISRTASAAPRWSSTDPPAPLLILASVRSSRPLFWPGRIC